MHTKTIFCAGCQADSVHDLAVDTNQEIVATCQSCGRVLKFPADVREFPTLVKNQKESNEGQISAEEMQKQSEDILNKISDTEEA